MEDVTLTRSSSHTANEPAAELDPVCQMSILKAHSHLQDWFRSHQYLKPGLDQRKELWSRDFISVPAHPN